MKKFLLTFSILLSASYAFAAGTERVCFATASGPDCSLSGAVSPCASVSFVVDQLIPPAGYVLVGKFEWFVNGVSVKTTTDPSDPILQWTIVSNPTNVYCKVSYKARDNSLSAPYTSTTFSPNIKQLNFGNIVGGTNANPNYGCPNTASYSLNTYTCSGFCDYTYPVSSYNITWQPPIGWTQTSISPNGNNVSFTPNAASGGVLTATINLPCGFKEKKTFNITRVAQAPTFSSTSPVSTCASSATISINPTCGASSYTYTIIGGTGVKFAANGLQTLTTTSTSSTLSLSGAPSSNTVKAKSNYVNNNVSSEASAPFNYGAVPPGPITVVLADGCLGKLQVEIAAVAGATSYNWYKDNVLQASHSTFAQMTVARNTSSGVGYGIQVEAISSCGTSARTYKGAFVPACSNYALSPNPASSTVEVSSIDYSSEKTAANNSIRKETIHKIWIVDKMGTVIRQFNYTTPLWKAYIDISGLKADTYLLKIYNGKNWISKKLIKV